MADHRHTTAWKKARAAVLAQSTICWLCGNPGADTVDHVLELKRGGTNDPSNLRPAHGKKIPGVCRGNYSRSAGLRRGTSRAKGKTPGTSRTWG